MLTFKEISGSFHLLRWIQQKLIFNSPLGSKKLASLSLNMSTEELTIEYDRMDRLRFIMESTKGTEFYNKISHTISTFRDIGNVLEHIETSVTLSELELFEIKYFSHNYIYFCSFIREYDLQIYEDIDLAKVFQLLDPDKTGVTSFYLYDSYSLELAGLRKRIKNGESNEELYQDIENISYQIREKLSIGLKPFVVSLKSALDLISCWDLLIAKILFAKEFVYCRPEFCAYNKLSYAGLYNPYLKSILETKGKKYQPVDISLADGPTIITGANMSGKTMVLKSVALAQYLVQFGFYAPAVSAKVPLFDEIRLLSGDTQDEIKGLSSFGAEIIAISEMVETIYDGKSILALLDEPARTTSPDEGVAIVNAILDILSEQKVMSLVTTHYNKLNPSYRCLRVKGFVEEAARNKINNKNIDSFIDYQLIDARINEGISEALTVARLLNVNEKLLMRIDSNTHEKQQESE